MKWSQTFVESFLTLLVILDPPAVMPAFLALTGDADARARRRAAYVAVGVAAAVLAVFAVVGPFVFRYLSVSVESLMVAGGLLLLTVALLMFLRGPQLDVIAGRQPRLRADRHAVSGWPRRDRRNACPIRRSRRRPPRRGRSRDRDGPSRDPGLPASRRRLRTLPETRRRSVHHARDGPPACGLRRPDDRRRDRALAGVGDRLGATSHEGQGSDISHWATEAEKRPTREGERT